jgi:hypothetical protein
VSVDVNKLANEAMESIEVEDSEEYAFARCAIEDVITKAVAEFERELAASRRSYDVKNIEADHWKREHQQERAAHERTRAELHRLSTEAAVMRSFLRCSVCETGPANLLCRQCGPVCDTCSGEWQCRGCGACCAEIASAGRDLSARILLLEAVAEAALDSVLKWRILQALCDAVAALDENGGYK